ncbi:MAG: peptidoglycan/LPS O-acetylase OafA/YrhL [Planctomycetota bacterium]|jgi:peptidoglycan/LPS O-acetylase OafA/YrhL
MDETNSKTKQALEGASAQGRSRRILELDALRGLAALAVVLYHYTTRYEFKVGHTSAPAFSVPFGHYGVELFFLLSGFVIFMTLQRTKRARDFVISRFSRLYPGFWVGMAVTLAAIGMMGLPFAGYSIGAKDILVNAAMLQRYVPGTRFVDGAYWTLCVELTFYGWIFMLFLSGHLKRVRLAIAALVGLELALHFVTNGGDITAPFPLRALRQVALAHFGPYFGAGILFYQLRNRAPGSSASGDFFGILACLVAVALMRPMPDFIASVVCFGIFALLVGGKLSFLASRPLLFLGAISYSLYVVHQNVGFLLLRHAEAAGMNPNLAILLATAVSLAIATAITFLVERPALQGIRRLTTRSTPVAQTGIKPAPLST